ncbi:hypothetical protein V6582_08400 [Agrobacterium vitis]|uniref:hypothetical protein n=1 Tax=Agrobacterium vitis TaxID=373 RepID=UPI0030DECC36
MISDDFPTLERPAKAISSGPSGGRNFIDGTPRIKIHGRPNSGWSLVAFVAVIVFSPAADPDPPIKQKPRREAGALLSSGLIISS